MPHQTLRIIDANVNRIGEGLRFLEDIARFLLNDADLGQQLRAIRHDTVESSSTLGIKLLSHRDSEHDVGAAIESPNEQAERDLPALIVANAKRVEESLRVIEELAKLPEINSKLDSSQFKQRRFALYSLEQRLLSKILRRNKLEQLTGLYLILDSQALKGRDEVEVAGQAIQGGARVIQLRDKHRTKKELLPITQKLKELCTQANVLFIVNDYLDLALAADADGVHIGQDDLPLSAARRQLPVDKIIGCSTTTVTQALKAQAEGADYIAVGSVFPSPTKKEATVVGIETLRQIKQAVSLPIVAIGGINKDNIEEVINAGADSAAVISAVLSAENVEEAVRHLVAKIEQRTKSQ